MRRALASTILELAASLASTRRPGLSLAVRRLELDLPFECDVVRRPESLDFVGDVPRWRWTTAFDPLLGRLQLVLEEITA
jgi:hypothetical protein